MSYNIKVRFVLSETEVLAPKPSTTKTTTTTTMGEDLSATEEALTKTVVDGVLTPRPRPRTVLYEDMHHYEIADGVLRIFQKKDSIDLFMIPLSVIQEIEVQEYASPVPDTLPRSLSGKKND